jgi:nucleoside-triphosphatase THEP1
MTSAWKRAAAFGSLWAASEIVLGSLLHTLRVPLAGTLLAAIGVAILVAGLRLRGEPGVALRAGIVCALMKSISPGAVIIGPMIGIMLEAAIIEGVTRITRRSVPGLLLAGALATATPIVQKIVSLLIVFGPSAADIYVGLYKFASSALGVSSVGPLDLLLAFVAAAAFLGAVAAGAGLHIASLASLIKADPLPLDSTRAAFAVSAPEAGQTYSIPLLAFHVLALSSGLALIAAAPLWAAAAPVAGYAALSFLRYRRIARMFSRPRLWIEFAVVAFLAAVALGALNPGGDILDGLYAGGQMVTRGILVIVALSAISVELRSPAVLGWFLGRGLGSTADAVAIAASALPGIVRLFGDERQILRHPVRALSGALAATVAWIDEAATLSTAPAPVFILTGAQGIGKTTRLVEVVRLLREDGIEPCGFLSTVSLDGETRAGYDLHILSGGSPFPLARRRGSGESPGTGRPTRAVPASEAPSAGPFAFFEDAIEAGRAELPRASARPGALVIVDEVGPLEMMGQGWTPALLPLVIARTHPLILVVRPSLVMEVCRRWNLEPVEIWDASVIDARAIWTDLRLAFTDRALYSHAGVGYLADVAR